MAFKVVILGGTSEGRQLAEILAGDSRYAPVLSFAGRTASLQVPRAPYRVGGFGGVPGLAEFLRAERCAALVDATHPFAAQMSSHAVLAAQLTRTPLLRVECPAWRAVAGDRWTSVASMSEAAVALGERPQRVFLSVGRLEVGAFLAAPQHEYLVRAVDEFVPGLPRARVLAARGPFELAAERELLLRERIEVVVSKNAGTPATYAKLVAARELGLPVILVARPLLPPVETVDSFEPALRWLEAVAHASREPRGV
ncbi:MAG TPA: cobalt-precorrin-6A reductase [Polyangiaceae bacterium]|nr:cobalt-precorrin-6A reductase [Polyangiaceae bacterium]